jgi:biotin carboxyl carrier protein
MTHRADCYTGAGALTTRHYVIDGQSFDVEIVERSGTHAIVSVNGQLHDVDDVAAPRFVPSAAAAQHVPSTRVAKSGPGELRAPMAGRVVQLNSQAGEQVNVGAPLVVLDAMKMENTLRAPSAGRVEEIPVAVGDTVLQGALLVRLT